MPSIRPSGTLRGEARHDPTTSASNRIRQEYFRRFLSRVFSEGTDCEWLLKGGMGMLARVSNARATRDIDLHRVGHPLEDSLRDLRRLASVDLGDHFRFIYLDHASSITGEQQPYAEGCTVRFDVYLGVTKKDTISIDIALNTGVTGDIEVAAPASGLSIPRLVSHRYRLYPVVDQIADKVCATIAKYESGPSSREKDLVDLVVLAVTHDVDGLKLACALTSELRRRLLYAPEQLTVPTPWGVAYARMAKQVPPCADFPTVPDALALVGRLVNPALHGTVTGKSWSSEALAWS